MKFDSILNIWHSTEWNSSKIYYYQCDIKLSYGTFSQYYHFGYM